MDLFLPGEIPLMVLRYLATNKCESAAMAMIEEMPLLKAHIPPKPPQVPNGEYLRYLACSSFNSSLNYVLEDYRKSKIAVGEILGTENIEVSTSSEALLSKINSLKENIKSGSTTSSIQPVPAMKAEMVEASVNTDEDMCADCSSRNMQVGLMSAQSDAICQTGEDTAVPFGLQDETLPIFDTTLLGENGSERNIAQTINEHIQEGNIQTEPISEQEHDVENPPSKAESELDKYIKKFLQESNNGMELDMGLQQFVGPEEIAVVPMSKQVTASNLPNDTHEEQTTPVRKKKAIVSKLTPEEKASITVAAPQNNSSLHDSKINNEVENSQSDFTPRLGFSREKMNCNLRPKPKYVRKLDFTPPPTSKPTAQHHGQNQVSYTDSNPSNKRKIGVDEFSQKADTKTKKRFNKPKCETNVNDLQLPNSVNTQPDESNLSNQYSVTAPDQRSGSISHEAPLFVSFTPTMLPILEECMTGIEGNAQAAQSQAVFHDKNTEMTTGLPVEHNQTAFSSIVPPTTTESEKFIPFQLVTPPLGFTTPGDSPFANYFYNIGNSDQGFTSTLNTPVKSAPPALDESLPTVPPTPRIVKDIDLNSMHPFKFMYDVSNNPLGLLTSSPLMSGIPKTPGRESNSSNSSSPIRVQNPGSSVTETYSSKHEIANETIAASTCNTPSTATVTTTSEVLAIVQEEETGKSEGELSSSEEEFSSFEEDRTAQSQKRKRNINGKESQKPSQEAEKVLAGGSNHSTGRRTSSYSSKNVNHPRPTQQQYQHLVKNKRVSDLVKIVRRKNQ